MSTSAWLVLGLGLGGLLFGGIGLGMLLAQRDFRRIALRASGQVVRLRPSRADDGVVYYATVRFVTVNGQVVEAETGFGSDPPPAPLGARVRLLYDPARPDRMRMEGLWRSGALIGVVFAGTGAALLVAASCAAVFAW